MIVKKTRTISIILILLIVVITSLTVYSIATETQKTLKGAIQKELITVSGVTASQIDGDAFARIKPGEENTQNFIRVRDQLWRIKQATPDLHFIYTMQKTGEGVAFVVDGDYGHTADAAIIGQPYPEAEPELIAGFTAPSANEDFTTDQWGTVLSGFSPIRDSTGNVVGIVGVDMDSTLILADMNRLIFFIYSIGILAMIAAVIGIFTIEHRREIDEQKVEESERKYRLLFERAGDAIFLLEADGETRGKIITANKAAADMHGYSVDELQNLSITDLDAPATKAGALERFDRTVNTKLFHGELLHLKKDGSVFPVEISAGRFDLGMKKYILAIYRDISTRKQTENALQQATKKINLLNTVTFNDIQNAIFSLKGFNELARSAGGDERVKGYLDKENESVQRITRALNFAGCYQDLGIKPPKWQNINQTFVFAISHRDFSSISRNVHVEGLEIYADHLLERVFQALADNVVKHAKTATEVAMGYHETPDGLTLVFEDNGIGIPDTRKEAVFERGSGSHKGMELFLVREILSITGISILETGEFGKGARFEILVPKGAYRFVGAI
ncbi:MAG: PAS domain S-box protein [Methanoregula sp.]